MKVLILVGSGDKDSHSLHLGQAISAQLEKSDVEVELINLVEYGLPLYDRSLERAKTIDDRTAKFLEKSYEVDAFVWITPIHHNSFSAILKNALDWQHTKFPGKTVGLASNGGDRSPQAVDHLMSVARAQHLVASPTRVCTDASDYNEAKEIEAQDIKERVVAFCDELISITKKISS